MPWIIEKAAEHAGEVLGNGQCVRFLQVVGKLPNTSKWKRGALARGATLEKGTAIATFDPDGSYGNHIDGRSHAAVLDRAQINGLMVWDQWVGQPVHRRLIKFRNGAGKAVNDGDRF
jgi:hypothetical protein